MQARGRPLFNAQEKIPTDLSQNGYGLLICTQPIRSVVDCWSISIADVYSTHKDVGRCVVAFYS
eukprot:1982107-Prorocentrum_lima.AAC.1